MALLASNCLLAFPTEVGSAPLLKQTSLPAPLPLLLGVRPLHKPLVGEGFYVWPPALWGKADSKQKLCLGTPGIVAST